MPEKDSENVAVFTEVIKHTLPYLSTFVLSAWGGVVGHIAKIRRSQRKFKWPDLFMDVIVSMFAGMLTFYFCHASKMDDMISAALIAVSGHMGTRAIAGFEALYGRLTGVKNED